MPRGSQIERADITSQRLSEDWRDGSHALQLSFTHPSSAFVTMTTFSASSQACSSSFSTSSASSRSSSATSPCGGAPRIESPCFSMHVVDGHMVSSQSKIMMVCSGRKNSALLLEWGVKSSEIFLSSGVCGSGSACGSVSRYGCGAHACSPAAGSATASGASSSLRPSPWTAASPSAFAIATSGSSFGGAAPPVASSSAPSGASHAL
mmetsp:Transcript_4315/g.12150  ORF Transcript_4315/g.12150 Transcript_4315/m.12150 type:complete len:207 (-) Transcript_4315:48-668(-)